jgi:hypothetical protein
MTEKKEYTAPELTEHGTIEDLTLGWLGPVCDAMTGQNSNGLGGYFGLCGSSGSR